MTTASTGSLNSPTSGNGLRRLLSTATERHRTWTQAAILSAVCAALCLFASVFDDRLLNGVSVWNKPFKFFTSISVYFGTLAWFAPLARPGYWTSRAGRVLTAVPLFWAALELFYITFQAARGEPSHFNTAAPIYEILYGVMGFGAVMLVAVCLWLGVHILRARGTDDPYVLAVGLGLIGGLFGGYLGGNDGHWVGGVPSDAGGLPVVHWSRTGGDLRIAHFFGIHAMQIIPIAGALAARILAPQPARLGVIVFTIAFAALSTSTFLQAVGGAPLVPLS